MLLEYVAELRRLQFPMPAGMADRSYIFADFPPKCYTNYNPHYNYKYFLNELVINPLHSKNHSWKLVQDTERLLFNKPFGYLDNRPYLVV